MSKQVTRRPTKNERRQDRREEQRRREEERLLAAKRRRATIISVIAVAALLAVSVSAYIIYANVHNSNTQVSATPTAELGPNALYPPIDNISSCLQNEQLAYHIHVLLTIYVNGQQFTVPQNVGIAPDQSCLYFLHTHDTTGVVHIEAPATLANHIFILGNFLDEWGTRFSTLGYPSQLDLLTGWTTYVNGKAYKGDFHNIPLQAHTLITLAYNSPGVTPVTTYNWNGL